MHIANLVSAGHMLALLVTSNEPLPVATFEPCRQRLSGGSTYVMWVEGLASIHGYVAA